MQTEDNTIHNEFMSATYQGNFEKIRYYLSSPTLSYHAQINEDGHAFGNVCAKNSFDAVKYMLTSPELKEHADIHIDNERGLACALTFLHFELAHYLLTSPELAEHAQLTDSVYSAIFKMHSYDEEDRVVDYLTGRYAFETHDYHVYEKIMKFDKTGGIHDDTILKNLVELFLKEPDNLILANTLKTLNPTYYENYLHSLILEEKLPEKEIYSKTKRKI